MPSPEVSPSLLTVIIPTLNAAGSLPHTLATLEEAGAAVEVIVVDGGSTDNTRTLAPRCIVAPRGRGAQLAAGAAAAEKATWLLFLHADTRLAPGWWAEARAHMETHSETAATFRFALDALAPQARRIERLVAWRCRWLGLPYGDQGLLIPRALYDAIGGFRPLPLMEDVDMVRRLGRRRLRFLNTAAITSAVRYHRDGWILRPLRNLTCLGLWWLGVPANQVARLYHGRRA